MAESNTTTKTSILSLINHYQDTDYFRELNWEGSFAEYLEIVQQNPRVTRSAFQRVYDMILSYGKEEYTEYKRKIIRYSFFKDLPHYGKDAVYGLDIHLSKMVDIFKAAAQRYGTERRVLLLHGPVGSSKSTIVRLLKKGLEEYSKTPEGALYTFNWTQVNLHDETETLRFSDEMPCPMHEEPLHLIPIEFRAQVVAELNKSTGKDSTVTVEGDLCPACRQTFRELSKKYNGDWIQVMSHIKVRRLILSEKDRIGVGTFQPKDEKNQDSTELAGDINYRKIAIYGSDSDARAFNFDGEFNVANRGIIEFIEVLKLDVAFLYDLLGA